tara:strand:- start:11384 stop:12094 length:711 start_codon:yes stop_codon:yes gene_type:complete
MLSELNKKIIVFADGPKLDEINIKLPIDIDGYTFNPSLFRKNNAKDYLNYSTEILEKCGDKPVSLEVITDSQDEMIRQGIKLGNLKNNVYVKVPVVFSNGKSTKEVIKILIKEKIKLNITAIFTLDQIREIINDISDSNTILSIFVGRIFDSGIDGEKIIEEINSFIKNNSRCQSLWASTRMPFDIIKAINTKTNIITMPIEHIKKLSKFGMKQNICSIETVKQFYVDALKSGFKF